MANAHDEKERYLLATTAPATLGLQSHRALGDGRALAARSRTDRERSEARRRADARSPRAWALRVLVVALLAPGVVAGLFLSYALVVKIAGWF